VEALVGWFMVAAFALLVVGGAGAVAYRLTGGDDGDED
jgi:hypothetical protein